MKNSSRTSIRLWFHTWIILNIAVSIYVCSTYPGALLFCFLFSVASFIGSLPALLIYFFALRFILRSNTTGNTRFANIMLVSAGISILYGLIGSTMVTTPFGPVSESFLMDFVISASALCVSSFLSNLFNRKYLYTQSFIPSLIETEIFKQPKNTNMETYYSDQPENTNSNGNKALIKGLVTGALILAMLIPTLFISSLVSERQQRQQEVVKEVSSKWAGAQTVTAPYLYIPYYHKDSTDRKKTATQYLVLLPDNLEVNGEILPEQRLRSIYKVRLYKSHINTKGSFVIQLPKDIDVSSLVLNEAKICVGISDFKGIEKKVDIRLNGSVYTLFPGLPTDAVDSSGLSSPIDLTTASVSQPISFEMPLSLKGSEQLHFVPLSGNSQFNIHSSWADPSFDGNSIPSERTVTDTGFSAKWTFNKANLPFGTLLKNERIYKRPFEFGISMGCNQPINMLKQTAVLNMQYFLSVLRSLFSSSLN